MVDIFCIIYSSVLSLLFPNTINVGGALGVEYKMDQRLAET